MLSTYENGHKILNDIRHDLNEHSTARLQGSSTSGVYDNDWIMRQVNIAQARIYARLMQSMPSEFLCSSTLSFVSSVASLPFDFGRILELKDDHGRKVFPSTIKALPSNDGTGSARLYYRKGSTLVLQQTGITANYTLWYHSKPRDIIQGKCATQNKILSGKLIADYYNGLTLESITGAWVDTITDYAADTTATFSTKTLAANDYYGTVSEIPEVFHRFISPLASMICRATHPRTQSPVTKSEYQLWSDGLDEVINMFGQEGEDMSIEEIFTDYATEADGFGDAGLFPGS